MEVVSQEEADHCFKSFVDGLMSRHETPRVETEEAVRSYLGYYAGYYSNEVRERVERLFRCEHPVFGPIALNGPPSPETAFRLGQEWAKHGPPPKIKTLWQRLLEE
jgi:hypothetical protein